MVSLGFPQTWSNSITLKGTTHHSVNTTLACGRMTLWHVTYRLFGTPLNSETTAPLVQVFPGDDDNLRPQYNGSRPLTTLEIILPNATSFPVSYFAGIGVFVSFLCSPVNLTLITRESSDPPASEGTVC